MEIQIISKTLYPWLVSNTSKAETKDKTGHFKTSKHKKQRKVILDHRNKKHHSYSSGYGQLLNSNDSIVVFPQYLESSRRGKDISQGFVTKLFMVKELNYKQDQDSIELYADLFISGDGVVRLKSALAQVCFGWLGFSEKVEEHKKEGIVNIIQRREKDILHMESGLEKAMQMLERFPGKEHKEVSSYIRTLIQMAMERQKQMKLFETDENKQGNSKEEFIQKKEEEFQQCIKLCTEFISSIPKGLMYVYSIGRINPITMNEEMMHVGYSEAYLNFLGIDASSLAQLLLRRKNIDLVKNSLDITKLSANSLFMRLSYLDENDTETFSINDQVFQILNFEENSCDIVTFDGFNLTLQQKSKILPLGALLNQADYPSKLNQSEDSKWEYFLIIYELDVELNELEALIDYRQRLVKNKGKLNFEDFLRQELSLLFEDVEYSVHSQNFLEKYYSEKNLPSLNNLKDSLESTESIEQQRCNYRYV